MFALTTILSYDLTQHLINITNKSAKEKRLKLRLFSFISNRLHNFGYQTLTPYKIPSGSIEGTLLMQLQVIAIDYRPVNDRSKVTKVKRING